MRSPCRRPWRFLDTGEADPYYNMAVDEAIAKFGLEEQPPTIRVYRWKPAAISIGYSQRVRQTVNLRKCARRGIPLVRRLTGGRAVFHDEELTYSVIAPRNLQCFSDSASQTYQRIGQALVVAFERLGICAHLQRIDSSGSGSRGAQELAPCFISSGRYEVMVGSRKVAGSAQRRLDGVVLQHGSVLLGDGHQRIAEFLSPEHAQEGERMIQALRQRTASLGALLSRPTSYAQVAEALFWGFQAVFQVTLEPGQLLPRERSLAHGLVRDRYGRQEWTLRR